MGHLLWANRDAILPGKYVEPIIPILPYAPNAVMKERERQRGFCFVLATNEKL